MTTVTHKGTDREWSGPLDNWMAHSECIKHWCYGGEVEGRVLNGVFALCDCGVTFYYSNEYRIVTRSPKPGEVWLIDGQASLYSFDECSDWEFFELNGDNAWKSNDHELTKEYAAPTVESYYAAKFYKESLDQGGRSYGHSAALLWLVKKLVDRE